MNLHVTVEDEHFEFLRLQKGRLDEISDDRAAWHEAYEADLAQTFDGIRPFLPATCWGLLDIGSGLGGIDILIARHYAAAHRGPDPKKGWPYVHLLDGVEDRPEVILHRQTYNDMRVAKDFQVKNGLPPERFGFFGTREQFYPRPYDLVVSFGSWCFHYAPDAYLKTLRLGLHADTVLILDVRATKPEWIAELDETFQRIAVIATRPKWHRVVYGVR